MIGFFPMQNKHEWAWMKRVASPILCEDTCGIVAVQDGVGIVAMAVFDSFTISACNVHMAIENPMVLRHGFLPQVAHIAFEQRQREVIFGLTPDNNEKALKFNAHIGMKKVAHIEDAYMPGIGYVVTRMNKDECRWLDG